MRPSRGGWYINGIIHNVRQSAKAEVERGAERILAASQNVVPLNKDPAQAWHRGTLQRSGAVFAEHENDVAQATIRYGVDEPFDYAWLQETTDPYWSNGRLVWTHEPPGKAHYLEETFNDMKDDVIQSIGRRIAIALWYGRPL